VLIVPTGVEASLLASATIRQLNQPAVTPAQDITPHDQVSSTFTRSAFHTGHQCFDAVGQEGHLNL